MRVYATRVGTNTSVTNVTLATAKWKLLFYKSNSVFSIVQNCRVTGLNNRSQLWDSRMGKWARMLALRAWRCKFYFPNLRKSRKIKVNLEMSSDLYLQKVAHPHTYDMLAHTNTHSATHIHDVHTQSTPTPSWCTHLHTMHTHRHTRCTPTLFLMKFKRRWWGMFYDLTSHVATGHLDKNTMNDQNWDCQVVADFPLEILILRVGKKCISGKVSGITNSTVYCRGASILPLHRSLRNLHESSEKPSNPTVKFLSSLVSLKLVFIRCNLKTKQKQKGPRTA